ncbi:MAG: caspase family protein, partial [Symploca sp. SIO1A3]|nr:caspase family protein [Symploca sp. SIO1A3]
MSQIKRRHFLQFAGSALASIGLSQLDLMRQGDRYARVLAQGTSRKLALLVGINGYKFPIPPLRGCLTDVDLQRELLVNRFGFNPKDILLVTDEAEIKPSRQNILAAFENHLIKQAKPGDVVVFHFSGHGSRVIDPDPLPNSNGLNGTMVPPDRKSEDGSGKVRDIMGRSLFLLMHALQTENVTVVLDSCHSGGGTRGNVMFRALSRQGGGDDEATQEEFDYQEQWLSRLNLTPTKFQELRQKGIAKGVALGSAQQDQLATDAPFEGFHAGAFTYLLTRYLWQQPVSQPLKSVFTNLARSTKDVANSSGILQEPIQEVQPGSNYDQEPVYFIDPPTPSAEAVVQKAGSEVEFWLGGVASQTLESFEEGALFNLIDNQGNVLGEVEQTARNGLKGYGKLRGSPSGAIQSGTFMREQVRGVPSNLKLRLGLDSSLGNEVNSARSVLQSIQRVEAKTVNQGGVTDYLLGKMNSDYLQQARSYGITNPPAVGSIGLFSAGVEPIPDSFGEAGESAEAAIMRLRPRLKQLLAGRLLQQVVNGSSSNLKVENAIKPVGGRGVTAVSRGAQEAAKNSLPSLTTVQKLAPGTELKVEVTNQENRNIYMSVLVIGSNGDLVV